MKTINKNIPLRLGIEVECVLNEDIEEFNNLEIGEYHEGITIAHLKKWSCQSDSSISSLRRFESNLCVEFVSWKFSSLDNAKKGIEDLIIFLSNNYKRRFEDTIYINKSCGVHVHLSFYEKPLSFSIGQIMEEKKHNIEYYFNNFIIYEVIKKTRGLFFKRIKESSIINKELIIKNYNREHAKIIKRNSFLNSRGIRNSEFNFTSESNHKGIEWRSLNMNGLSSWEDFKEFFNIVFECLEYFIKTSQEYKAQENIKLLNHIEKKKLINQLDKKEIIQKVIIHDKNQEIRKIAFQEKLNEEETIVS